MKERSVLARRSRSLSSSSWSSSSALWRILACSSAVARKTSTVSRRSAQVRLERCTSRCSCAAPSCILTVKICASSAAFSSLRWASSKAGPAVRTNPSSSSAASRHLPTASWPSACPTASKAPLSSARLPAPRAQKPGVCLSAARPAAAAGSSSESSERSGTRAALCLPQSSSRKALASACACARRSRSSSQGSRSCGVLAKTSWMPQALTVRWTTESSRRMNLSAWSGSSRTRPSMAPALPLRLLPSATPPAVSASVAFGPSAAPTSA
mmetsp:Transcript_106236/g.342755  ORF Transcript_106236/g.342755 Transcript_106236/m.342755 type:complete len:269 (-) Transcript_106236:549-1355(-)